MPLFDLKAAASIESVRRQFSGATTAICLTTAMMVCGCATQHNSQQPQLAAAPTANVSPAAVAAPSADADARRIAAEAKKLNLAVVKTDGQVRYCRSNEVTGSRFQKDRQCYTADQVEALHEQTQQTSSR